MILTEKDAKEKACCDGGYGTVIRADDEGKYNCIASKCMAWRWAVDPRGEPAMKKEGGEYRETGYCGLAGEPESTA
jgi:hypothetical protein